MLAVSAYIYIKTDGKGMKDLTISGNITFLYFTLESPFPNYDQAIARE